MNAADLKSEPFLPEAARWWLKVLAAALGVAALYALVWWITDTTGFTSHNIPAVVACVTFVAYALGRWHERNARAPR